MPQPPLERKDQSTPLIPVIIGTAVALVGIAHLFGWLFGHMAQFGHSAITMKANAALCLILTGFALSVLCQLHVRPAIQWLARSCAFLVLLIGALTLSEHLTGWNLGIDQVLASEPSGSIATSAPNRMGPTACICFFLLGTALLLGHRRPAPAQFLALAVCAISLFPTVGYLYAANGLFAVARVTAIAWPTATSLLLLGAGILCSRPYQGLIAVFMADDPGGAMIRRLMLPMVLMFLGLGWLRLAGERWGWFDAPMGTGLMIVLFILTFSCLTFFAGRRVSLRSAETRRYAEALELSQAKFAKVFAQNPAGVAITRLKDGILLDANEALQQMLGYSREELVGRSTAPIWPSPEDRTAMIEALRRSGSFRGREQTFVTKSGERLVVLFSADVLTLGAEQVILGTVLDISDRKQAEIEMKAAHASAERAKRDAEEASKAKDHFLAVLSHELRNPLTPVLTAATLLEEDQSLPAEAREQLEVIRRNAQLEARLIDDLLDVTRVTRGMMVLHTERTELCLVIHRAVEVCKSDLDARGIHFGIDWGPRPYWVHADVARLQQVFWNLLKNAIKFTPHGGCVGIRCRPLDHERVTIEVNDSGIGIEPDMLPLIFNAFQQAERSITRQFGGLGLGLTISKALVELHGGRIEAESAGKGKGATFRVHLPLHTPAGPASPAPSLPSGQAADRKSEIADRKSLRILLVEDHGDTARIMQRLLENDGHSVQRAGDLATAIEAAQQGSFDLLLSDLGLPDGSGLDLLRTLRQKGNDVRAIALSGYGQEQDIQRSRDAGFAAHLTKPASPEQLREAIARVATAS